MALAHGAVVTERECFDKAQHSRAALAWDTVPFHVVLMRWRHLDEFKV